MATTGRSEAAALASLLQVSLTPEPGLLHLADLAAELATERAPDPARPLTRALADRALVAALSTGARAPLPYLVSVYAAADAAARRTGGVAGPDGGPSVEAEVKELAVSYAGVALYLGAFPDGPDAPGRGHLAFLDMMDAASAAADGGLGGFGPSVTTLSGPAASAPLLPPGFWDAFAARWADQGLDDTVAAIALELASRAGRATPLGDAWRPTLRAFLTLASAPASAAALVAHPRWLPPPGATGRVAQTRTLLGPLFGVSVVPDAATARDPAVSDAVGRLLHPATAAAAAADLEAAQQAVHGALHAVVMALLRSPAPSVKPATLAWLAAALNANTERGKLVPDPSRAGAMGWGLNLHAVLLRVAAPFTDPSPAGRAWGKVSASFLADGAVSFEGDTRLAADEAGVRAWEAGARAARAAEGGGAGAPPPPHHFVNFAFWATLKASLYGGAAALAELQTMAQRAHAVRGQARAFAAEAAAAAGTPAAAAAAARAEEARQVGDAIRAYSAVLAVAARDGGVGAAAAAFARVQAAWALQAAAGAPAAPPTAPPSLPLPPPTPDWTVLPEALLTTLADVLTLAPPATFEGPAGAAAAGDAARAAVVFIASPAHVRNPYVRSQLLGLLHGWLGAGGGEDGGEEGGGGAPLSAHASPAAAALDGDALARGHLVRSLLLLYADIEATSRDAAFSEKFGVRLQIAQVLGRLWASPPHRAAWLAVAAAESGGADAVYARFMHFLLQDATYLLDEAMAKLRVVSAAERARADAAAWAARPATERDETDAAAAAAAESIPGALDLASACVRLLGYSTVPAAGAAPWLGRAMVGRTAASLNYFLALLVGSSRSKLKVGDPASLHWDPKALLAGLAGVYVNLWRAAATAAASAAPDHTNPLAAAIAADDRSYGSTPALFTEAASIVRALGLLPPADADALDALAAAAAVAATAAAAVDESDAPDEFVCAIMSTLMADPVRLPGSGQVVDRASVERALVSEPRDPFTRTPLTRDELVALPELKARIEAWRAGKVAAAKGGG